MRKRDIGIFVTGVLTGVLATAFSYRHERRTMGFGSVQIECLYRVNRLTGAMHVLTPGPPCDVRPRAGEQP